MGTHPVRVSPLARGALPVGLLASDLMDLEHVERRLRARLDALGPAPRAELLHVLMLSDLERTERIGEFWSYRQGRALAEEDRVLRGVFVAMLREKRAVPPPTD